MQLPHLPQFRHQRGRRLVGAAALAASCLSWLAAPPPAAASASLKGTLVLTAGSCSGGTVSGTYLRMILPSGSASGPFMSNSDSDCSNQSYTPLSGGTDGGLIVGSYQPMPSPPFSPSGNALARRITGPTAFEGTNFATSTNPVDPQTKTKVSPPSVTVHGDKLTADLRSFAVTWNKQYFNQGSPKPTGTYPGNTSPATGTYDASTGAFTLNWTSQVVGGPFDKFTGSWHLAGHFVPAGRSTAPASTHTSHSSARSAGTSTTSSGSGHSSSTTGTTATTSTGHHVAATRAAAKGNAASGNSVGSAAATGTNLAPDVAASTSTVSKEGWHASRWLIATAAAIAVLGFGALAGMNRVQRRGPAAS
jgi:hypothetical protein